MLGWGKPPHVLRAHVARLANLGAARCSRTEGWPAAPAPEERAPAGLIDQQSRVPDASLVGACIGEGTSTARCLPTQVDLQVRAAHSRAGSLASFVSAAEGCHFHQRSNTTWP